MSPTAAALSVGASAATAASAAWLLPTGEAVTYSPAGPARAAAVAPVVVWPEGARAGIGGLAPGVWRLEPYATPVVVPDAAAFPMPVTPGGPPAPMPTVVPGEGWVRVGPVP